MALRNAAMVCLGLLLLAVALPSVRTNPIDTPAGPSPSGSVLDGSSEATPPASQEADASNKALPEGSKMSKFLDDFTSAFKHGTAKMKESLESAASSVKDGVLQGYDYVRSKLTGVKPEQPPQSSGEDESAEHAQPTSTSTAGALTSEPAHQPEATVASTAAAPSTRRPQSPAISSGSAEPSLVAFGGAVGVSNEPAQIVPNDDDDDERIIFNDKDYKGDLNGGGGADPDGGGDRDVTETPVPTTSVTVDNRFIIAGPLACKSGQEVVNGKCRNIF
ncbi:uncharacterized protein LOC128272685 [Anopheles cruzii]|uniref:uncharacterized protein LOC128272685 n=1 Tax=Anopheles cruzii TaxID=68878 RepID=UPI0022EC31D8|nr:uncharacterized protein LOC128272685 [Anopheles cruzii]